MDILLLLLFQRVLCRLSLDTNKFAALPTGYLRHYPHYYAYPYTVICKVNLSTYLLDVICIYYAIYIYLN